MVILLIPPNKDNYIRDTFYGCWHKAKLIDYSWPPTYLYQLNSIIKGSEVFDLSTIKFFDALNLVLSDKPKLILINTGTVTIDQDKLFLKKIKSKINCKVIAFGQHPTVNPKDTLKDGVIDICIRGEIEDIINTVIKNISNKNILKKIKGVCFNEYISKNKNLIKNLDNLPIPTINKNKLYFNPLIVHEPYTTMLITRGCPFSCTFCTVPTIYGKTFRKKSIEKVIYEIKQILNQGYKEIFIRDENLTLDKKYLMKLCKEIIKNKLKFYWICNSRVDTVDKKLINLMKQAGCHLIKFGVESSNQKVLDNLKKGITKKQIEYAFKICNELKIETMGHFMIGNPDETIKDIHNTIEFAIKLDPTYASFDILIHYPKTSVKKSNLSKLELEEMHELAFKNFYLRPDYIFKNAIATKSITQLKNKIVVSLKLWHHFIKNKF
jgi:anaerobic magnesium-protoporphyrin IX monomethyl ester cyclase